jgi:hypothetical protein
VTRPLYALPEQERADVLVPLVGRRVELAHSPLRGHEQSPDVFRGRLLAVAVLRSGGYPIVTMTSQTNPGSSADPDESALLTPRDQVLARKVLGRMPYLPLVPNHSLHEGATVRELVTILDGFADVLTRYGDQAAQTERELSELRADVAATRRILGTTPKGDEQL